jgi:hypothetical protein
MLQHLVVFTAQMIALASKDPPPALARLNNHPSIRIHRHLNGH